VKLTTAASADDVVVYRELAHLPLADLDLFGPAGQDAYRQMCAVEHLHPHTRTDIAFAGGA
jgi:hypothetical protein